MIDAHITNSATRQRLTAAIAESNAVAGPFFAALDSRRTEGWTVDSFLLLRDNFMFRTATTSLCVARVVTAALGQTPPDVRTANEIVRLNLLDELGKSDWTSAHLQLLVHSFNQHGRACFGLVPTSLAENEESPHILPSARRFRERQTRAYTSTVYLHVLGASAAQEAVATEMLDAIYKSAFVSVGKGCKTDQRAVLRYFHEHLDGTELRHADIGLDSAMRHIFNGSDAANFLAGANEFLSAQSQLWIELGDAIGGCRH